MSRKQSLLGVGRFYTAEEALTLLMNMSDFEDDSTSESENKGDSSASSEYAPEQQYQVRTDSNIQTVLPKETVNQNTTKCALLADELADEGKMWTILSENTNKYVNTKLRQTKDKGDKDPIELLSEGVDQNPCAMTE